MKQWPLVTVSDELDELVRAKLAADGKSYATVVRELMAKWVKRPDLADSVKMGRPRKDAE